MDTWAHVYVYQNQRDVSRKYLFKKKKKRQIVTKEKQLG